MKMLILTNKMLYLFRVLIPRDSYWLKLKMCMVIVAKTIV